MGFLQRLLFVNQIMFKPTVSIIISTYNRKDSVRKAIESVLNQTYPDIEIIVVDDCSTDGTYEELTVEYLDHEKVTILTLPENSGGPAKPRNLGILESKGEIIGFLDDDNVYRPDHVTCLLNELDRDPTLSLAYGDRYVINEFDPSQNEVGVYYDFSSAILMQRNFIDTSDFLVRREDLFEIGGWDERYRRMLDWNLVARLDKAGKKMRRVPKIITDYYVHEGMLSEKPYDNEWCVVTLPGGVKTLGAYDCDVVLPFLGDKPEPKVAIFTLTYNRLTYTKASFESLYKTAGYEFDHYVIDNGSTDGTVEFLKEYEKRPNVTVIYNEDNKGIPIASNIVLKAIRDSGTKYDIIGKFDNDAYCQTHGWLQAMVGIYRSNQRIAMSCYISGLRDSAGGVPRYTYGKLKDELVGMTKHLGGICCFSDADVRLSFHLDEAETLHTSDDVMFSRYLGTLGYQMCYLENYYINHGPAGTQAQERDYPEYFERRKVERTISYGEK